MSTRKSRNRHASGALPTKQGVIKMEDKAHDIVSVIRDLTGDKIVTVSVSGHTQSFDVSREGAIGYDAIHAARFFGLIMTALRDGGAILVRQFTDQQETVVDNGEMVTLPVKNLYGIVLGKGKWCRLPPDGVREACTTDAKTGRQLQPEKAVVYCRFPAGRTMAI